MSPFRFVAAGVALAIAVGAAAPAPTAPVTGLTAGDRVARAYDAVFDAEFDRLPSVLRDTCPPAPHEACLMLDALGTWWRISLDPASRARDAAFLSKVEAAIGATQAWTEREPERAEAFFYLGAALGARVQWRVLRGERLAAARDGARIKNALERALALDPDFNDAHFGIGLYRYYAGVAPAILRMLRWLFMLPGGDRAAGLAEIVAARDGGTLIRSEADYQLHVIYLWYEKQFDAALRLVKGLQARHPRNPLFFQIEAEIAETYFHDTTSSLLAAENLLMRAQAGLVNEPQLAETRARLLVATALDRLAETDRALEHLESIIASHAPEPADAMARAQALASRARARLRRESYRVGLEGWRAFERGDLEQASMRLARSLQLDSRDAVARYRYATVLAARGELADARAQLERVLAPGTATPPVTAAAAHFDLARLLHDNGDRTGAVAHFDAASHTFGADPRVRATAAREAARLRTTPHAR